MDFASIATDSSILPLMQSQHDLVHLYQERTRIFPALQKAAMKLARLVLHVDHKTTLSTILGFLVGRIGFHLHTVVSLAGVFILQGVQTIEIFGKAINDDRTGIASMLSFYALWIGFRILCVVLKNTAFMWLKLFLLAPLFFFCSSRRFKTMIGTALLKGPLFWVHHRLVLHSSAGNPQKKAPSSKTSPTGGLCEVFRFGFDIATLLGHTIGTILST
jgi:hypothetical protein